MPSRAIVEPIGMVFKVVNMGGNQITKFYSKKLNPIFRPQVKGNSHSPQGKQ